MILVRRLLGDVLRQERLRQGRTLRDVSASAQVSLGYISEIERGQKEASSECLAAICGALEVPLVGGARRRELRDRPRRGRQPARRLAGRPSPARRPASRTWRPDPASPHSAARRSPEPSHVRMVRVTADSFPRLAARTMNFQLGLAAWLRREPGRQPGRVPPRRQRHLALALAVGVRRRDRRRAQGGRPGAPAQRRRRAADPGGARAARADAGLRRPESSPSAPTTTSRSPRSRCRRGSSSPTWSAPRRPAEVPVDAPVVDPRLDPTGRAIAYAGDRALHVVDQTGVDRVLVGPDGRRPAGGGLGTRGVHRRGGARPDAGLLVGARRLGAARGALRRDAGGGVAHRRPGPPRGRAGPAALPAGRQGQRRRSRCTWCRSTGRGSTSTGAPTGSSTATSSSTSPRSSGARARRCSRC